MYEIIVDKLMNLHTFQLDSGGYFNSVFGYIDELNGEISLYLDELEKEIRTLPSAIQSNARCSIYILFSLKCNFSCIYCFENNQLKKQTNSILSVYDCIRFLIQVSHMYNSISVTIFGGEPLLVENLDKISALMQFLNKGNFFTRVITNGYNLNIYDDIFSLYPPQEIIITIDGDKYIHDKRRRHLEKRSTYDVILFNLINCNFLKKNITKIIVRINLDKDNYMHCDGLFLDLISKSLSFISVSVYRTNNRSLTYKANSIFSIYEFAVFFEHIKEKYGNDITIKSGENIYNHIINLLFKEELVYPRLTYCEIGNILAISPDRNIYLCSERIGNKDFFLCNLDEFSKAKTQRLKIYQKSILSCNNKCAKCCVNTICGGGCKACTECEYNEIIKTINMLVSKYK